MMSQSGCSHEQNLKVILEAYNRVLFHFPFDHFPLEAEYHIWGALKKSPVFFPTHTLISAGVNNKFNHPNVEVVERLEENGSIIFNTKINGMVMFDFTNNKIKTYIQ